MTEFALILAIQVAALAYSLVVWRSVLSRGVPATRLRRLSQAIERAAAAFFTKQDRVLLGASALVAVVVAGLHIRFGVFTSIGRFGAGLGAGFGLLLGAVLAWTSARVALRMGIGASVQVTVAASRGLDRALALAARSGGAASIFSESLSSIGLIAWFGALFALLGGTTLEGKAAISLAREILTIVAAFPLGAALVALACQRSGGLYKAAADVGGEIGSEQRFGLAKADPRSPTLVSELAGNHLGESAVRAAFVFLLSSTAQVALLALGLAAVSLEATPSTALLLLPFLVRAFFVLASAFGCAVVRTEEMTNPSSALFRGYVSASVIGLSGLCGANLWLAKEHFWPFFLAGVGGWAMASLVAIPVWARLLRPALALRETVDALRLGSSSAAALTSLGGAAQATLLPVLAVGVMASVCWQIGTVSGVVSGGLWTSLIAWSAMIGSVPFAFAAGAVGTIAEGAPALAALSGVDPDAQRRANRLDEAQPIAASARAQLIASAAACAWLSAMALPAVAREPLRIEVGLLEPVVTWCGAIGAALVLGYAGSCARAAVRGGRSVAMEVDRQLRRFPREHGVALIPTDFSPSYKACVDLAARLALEGLALQILLPLAIPAALAVLLGVFYRSTENPRAVEGLMSLVLLSGVVGFAAALCFDVARATLLSVMRPARAQASAEAPVLVASDGAAEIFGRAAGPAAQVLMLSTGALALALAPFMH